MRSLAPALVAVALGACGDNGVPASGLHLDVDVVVDPTRLTVYLNASDYFCECNATGMRFPTGTCFYEDDTLGHCQCQSCLETVLIRDGERTFDLGHGDALPLVKEQPLASPTLVLRGCRTPDVEVPITLEPIATPLVAARQHDDGMEVSWSPTGPEGFLVVGSEWQEARCLVAGANALVSNIIPEPGVRMFAGVRTLSAPRVVETAMATVRVRSASSLGFVYRDSCPSDDLLCLRGGPDTAP